MVPRADVRCRDNTLYVGATADLEARLARHNCGEGCAFIAVISNS
jgi:predicted GIY-YIG superfamily endonuclease